MARIAIATASDGRDFVHEEVGPFGLDVQGRLAAALREAGHEVITGDGDLSSNTDAVRLGRELAAARPDLTLINYPVWAFPHFSLLFAGQGSGPLALFSNIDPQYPGMVGMLAAGGGFDQIGRRHSRTWGDPGDPAVIGRLSQLATAAGVAQGLRGTTFGRIGGRPMGMYTTVANTDQWMAEFGIDIEDIDQYELVRRGLRGRPGRHQGGPAVAGEARRRRALRRRQADPGAAGTADRRVLRGPRAGGGVAPGLLRHQGPAGDDQQLVHDGHRRGLPQRPLRLGRPQGHAGLLDRVRHGRRADHADHSRACPGRRCCSRTCGTTRPSFDVWDLCNSGQHATWFAARSDDPAENLARVHLYPEVLYFPAGGASVHHIAAPGEMTFARLTRASGRYRMHLLRGEFARVRRGDHRPAGPPVHVRVAARVRPVHRQRRGVPHPVQRQPHPRRAGDTRPSCGGVRLTWTSTSTSSGHHLNI